MLLPSLFRMMSWVCDGVARLSRKPLDENPVNSTARPSPFLVHHHVVTSHDRVPKKLGLLKAASLGCAVMGKILVLAA